MLSLKGTFPLVSLVPRSGSCYGRRHNINVKHHRTIFQRQTKTNSSLDDPKTVMGETSGKSLLKLIKFLRKLKSFYMLCLSSAMKTSPPLRRSFKGSRTTAILCIKNIFFIIRSLRLSMFVLHALVVVLKRRVPLPTRAFLLKNTEE